MAFSRNLLGTDASAEHEVVFRMRDGRHVRGGLSAVSVTSGGETVGVFGVAVVDDRESARHPVQTRLTPRQAQILDLLAAGASTEQMVETLGLSRQTVRNHVRFLLQRLGAHSRLEAVVLARQRGLIGN